MQRSGAEQALVAAKTLFFSLAAGTLLPRLDFLSSLIFSLLHTFHSLFTLPLTLGFRNLSLTLKLSVFRRRFQSQAPLPTTTTVPSSDLTLLSPPTKVLEPAPPSSSQPSCSSQTGIRPSRAASTVPPDVIISEACQSLSLSELFFFKKNILSLHSVLDTDRRNTKNTNRYVARAALNHTLARFVSLAIKHCPSPLPSFRIRHNQKNQRKNQTIDSSQLGFDRALSSTDPNTRFSLSPLWPRSRQFLMTPISS